MYYIYIYFVRAAAGCNLRPPFANGGTLLAPFTVQQLADLQASSACSCRSCVPYMTFLWPGFLIAANISFYMRTPQRVYA